MQPNSIHHQTAPREMDLYWLRESPAAKENRHLCAGETWLPIRDRLSGREVLPSLDPISLLAPQLSGQGDVKGGFTPLYTLKKSDPCKKIWQIKARLLEGGLCFPLDTAQGTEREAAEGAQGPAAQMSSLAGLSPPECGRPALNRSADSRPCDKRMFHRWQPAVTSLAVPHRRGRAPSHLLQSLLWGNTTESS